MDYFSPANLFLRAARNNPTDTSQFCLSVQTNGADGSKLAFILVSEKLRALDAPIVHTQHDEILVEAREDMVDLEKEIVKGAMEEAFRRILPQVRFIVGPRVIPTAQPGSDPMPFELSGRGRDFYSSPALQSFFRQHRLGSFLLREPRTGPKWRLPSRRFLLCQSSLRSKIR